MKEFKISPDRKVIKFLTFDNLFPPLLNDIRVVEWRRLSWFTQAHYLVLGNLVLTLVLVLESKERILPIK